MLTKMWSNRNTHSLLVGKQNSTATLEGSLVLSYKTKHTLKPHNSAVTLTWYLLNRVENLSLHRTQHTDVSTSFICYYQNLETWERFFSRWLNKLTHSDNGMLFSSKKEWALKPWNDMEESYTPSINWKKKKKKTNLKRQHTMWFQMYYILEKTKQWRQQDQWLLGDGGWRDHFGKHRGFLGQWK